MPQNIYLISTFLPTEDMLENVELDAEDWTDEQLELWEQDSQADEDDEDVRSVEVALVCMIVDPARASEWMEDAKLAAEHPSVQSATFLGDQVSILATSPFAFSEFAEKHEDKLLPGWDAGAV